MGNTEKVKDLLASGVDVNERNNVRVYTIVRVQFIAATVYYV